MMIATKEDTKIFLMDTGELAISGDLHNLVISPVEYVGYTVGKYVDDKFIIYSVHIQLNSHTITIDMNENLFKDLKDVTKQILKI
ncbi:MAG: hypothetical protein IJ180_08950 [Bacteroidales bacterium]|nr:hypothetical protein [Bacteroidales bacterium]